MLHSKNATPIKENQISNNKMIPLSIPNISGNEWTYVKDCLDNGWISSVGSYVTQFENMLAEFAGAKYGIAAMNSTKVINQRGPYIISPV